MPGDAAGVGSGSGEEIGEAEWAAAQSLLDRVPTESATQRLRRWRRQRVLLVAALILLTSALAVVLVVVVGAPSAHSEDVPTWQTATGFVLAGAGLLLQIAGLVGIVRTGRRLRAWNSPVAVLSRGRRKELLAQVRGRRPVEPERIPLARLLAEQLLSQRTLLVANTGLGISFVGQWIASPTTWRAVATAALGLLLAAGWVVAQRDARRARRFLEEHSSPTAESPGSAEG